MGIITIAFDDGYEETIRHCADFLSENGISATFAIPSSRIGITLENRHVSNEKDLKHLVENGHEIASHTTGHRNMLQLLETEGQEAVIIEMRDSKKELEGLLGIKVESFVFPFIKANHNEYLLRLAAEYYKSSRITTEGHVFNKFPIKHPFTAEGMAVTTDIPMDEYNKLVDIVSAHDLWLIEVFHLVSDQNTMSARANAPYRFFTHIDAFKDHIRHILSRNVRTLTQAEVMRG